MACKQEVQFCSTSVKQKQTSFWHCCTQFSCRYWRWVAPMEAERGGCCHSMVVSYCLWKVMDIGRDWAHPWQIMLAFCDEMTGFEDDKGRAADVSYLSSCKAFNTVSLQYACVQVWMAEILTSKPLGVCLGSEGSRQWVVLCLETGNTWSTTGVCTGTCPFNAIISDLEDDGELAHYQEA